MDSYSNFHPETGEAAPEPLGNDETARTPVFFPTPTGGHSSIYQTSISNPINIPCPAYPIPGILTPPDTPTSPYGFSMKQNFAPNTPTLQEVSFNVTTAYDSNARTCEENPRKSATFVHTDKHQLRKNNHPLCLRPGLRLDTNLEVHYRKHPPQVSELLEATHPDSCGGIRFETGQEIDLEPCDDALDAEIELGNEIDCHVEMKTSFGNEFPGENDRERKLKVLRFIGSDLRKIADQFQTKYVNVRVVPPLVSFEIETNVFEV